MPRRKQRSIAALLGFSSASTLALPIPSIAAASCSVTAPTEQQIAAIFTTNPTVKAADAALATARTVLSTKKTLEAKALTNYQKALKTPAKSDDAALLRAYQSAKQNRVTAEANVVSAQNRANAARQTIRDQISSQYATLCATATALSISVAPGSDQVKLAWNAVAGATAYVVSRDKVQITTTDARSYLDTDVHNGTGYSYTVTAIAAIGADQYITIASTDVTANPVLPRPTNVQAKQVETHVHLSWNASSHATKYVIFRDNAVIGEVATTEYDDYSLGGLYQIQAVEDSILSAKSTAVKLDVFIQLDQPESLIARAGNQVVSLSWDEVDNATGYRILRNGLTIGTATEPSFSDKTVANGTTYLYRVVATNGKFESLASASAVATPVAPLVIPNAPAGLLATAGNNQVALSWQPVSGATSYKIFRDASLLTSTSLTSFTDSTVLNGTTYTYTIKATNLAGDSALSASSSAKPALPAAPATPTGLMANVADKKVMLSWSATAGATSYQVYRDDVLIASPASAAYTDTAVQNGSTYTYVVKATNIGGVSATSDSITAKPMPPVPVAPTNLSANVSNAQVSLTWVASASATSYNVYRDGNLLASPTTTSYVDSTVINGVAYSYSVKAVNGTGESLASNSAAATPVAPPQAPTNLNATAANGQVSLSWIASATATTYKIYRGDALLVTTQVTSYTDKSVVNGTTYSYTVKAVNAGGESVASSVATAKPQIAAPSTPTGLNATIGSNKVTLTWNAAATATSYAIYRDGELLSSSATSPFVDSTAINGIQYSYTISASNAGGESTQSTAVTATPALPPAPSAPAGLSPTAGNAQVSLTWSVTATATGYKVYRDGVLIASPTTTSFVDTGLVNGTQYSYAVSATNEGGESGKSSASLATPQVPAPSTPTGLQATAGDTQVSLSWNAVASATSYKIYRGALLVTTQAGTSFTDTGLINGTLYSYTVKAVNAGGDSAASSGAAATPQVPAPSAPTGLQATAGDAKVTLTWNVSATATSYKVLRNGVQIGTSNLASYTDSTAVNGTAYTYTVKAVNAGGDSVASSSASATPLPPIPSAPTNLIATAGDAKVTLSWNAVSGATSYKVYRGATLVTTQASTSYVDTGLTNGTAYSYTVKATNLGGDSSASSIATATPVAAVTKLNAPTGLTANTATSLNTGAFRLSWSAVTGATSYTVYKNGTLLGTTSSTTYTPASTPAGSKNSYTVMATNATPAANSDQSAAISSGVYQGTAVNDQLGRTSYGQIQVSIIVTGTTITGCWATYPTNSDSGPINANAIPKLCTSTLSVQPKSSNATTAIASVSGASATSPAFKTSLANALSQAGL